MEIAEKTASSAESSSQLAICDQRDHCGGGGDTLSHVGFPNSAPVLQFGLLPAFFIRAIQVAFRTHNHQFGSLVGEQTTPKRREPKATLVLMNCCIENSVENFAIVLGGSQVETTKTR